jgi:hypothetical protein
MSVAVDRTGRFKDVNWHLANDLGQARDAQLAVLMDIRDELKQLNRTFGCFNFLEIPGILRKIRANTAKPRKATK